MVHSKFNINEVLEAVKDKNYKTAYPLNAFSINEVMLGTNPDPRNKPPENQIDMLRVIAGYQMGFLHHIRLVLSYSFEKNVPIRVTSGYREVGFNKLVGGVPNSYHIWRFDENGAIVAANDIKPIGVSMNQAHEILDRFIPELIWYDEEGDDRDFFHVSTYRKNRVRY